MRTAWICLGRNGDICNVLPLVYADKMAGNKPTFVVNREHAGILDGVGYCEKLVLDIDYGDVLGAANHLAKDAFDSIRVAQIHGAFSVQNRQTKSFATDMFGVAGHPHEFGLHPLVFDRRDYIREGKVPVMMPQDVGRPVIFLATNGHSSPFPQAKVFKDILHSTFDKTHHIVDLDEIRFERIYDVLGLWETVPFSCLVTTDTVWNHLATAVPHLPVIALASEAHGGWGASPLRPQQVSQIPYSKVRENIGAIAATIERACTASVHPRKVFHVYAHCPSSRHNLARSTWPEPGPYWVDLPFDKGLDGRNSDEMAGDHRSVPLINDVIQRAIESGAKGSDIILLTNNDICFGPTFVPTLQSITNECAWTHRRDFRKLDRKLSSLEICSGERQMGVDTFAFTARWWQKNRSRMPEMFVAREAWDLILLKMLLEDSACRIPACTYHELHDSVWIKERNNPANHWNHKQARRWMTANGHGNGDLMDAVCLEDDLN